jgi:hypothetical protein
MEKELVCHVEREPGAADSTGDQVWKVLTQVQKQPERSREAGDVKGRQHHSL